MVVFTVRDLLVQQLEGRPDAGLEDQQIFAFSRRVQAIDTYVASSKAKHTAACVVPSPSVDELEPSYMKYEDWGVDRSGDDFASGSEDDISDEEEESSDERDTTPEATSSAPPTGDDVVRGLHSGGGSGSGAALSTDEDAKDTLMAELAAMAAQLKGEATSISTQLIDQNKVAWSCFKLHNSSAPVIRITYSIAGSRPTRVCG